MRKISVFLTGFFFFCNIGFSQIPSAMELKGKIALGYSASVASRQSTQSEFYIIDIKIDKRDKKIISIDRFSKSNSASANLFCNVLKQLNSIDWKDALQYDQILIPVYYIPNFDGGVIEDYPIELKYGINKLENQGHIQYVYPTMIIQGFKNVK